MGERWLKGEWMAVSNLTMASIVDDPAVDDTATATQASVAVCRERGCSAPGTLECAYVDSRARPCATRWCPRHVHRIGAGGYCRRHASTVAALGGKAADPRALPSVDYRGASLVSWICSEGVSTLFEAVASALRPGEVVFEDRTVNVVRLAGGERRWEQGWRICDRNGVRSKVMICVGEDNDSLVWLEVDESLVAIAVPPWITRRRANEEVAPARDASDRTQFYGFLTDHIRRGLAARA